MDDYGKIQLLRPALRPGFEQKKSQTVDFETMTAIFGLETKTGSQDQDPSQ